MCCHGFLLFLFNWKSTTKWHKKEIQVDIFLESFLLAVLNVISIFFFQFIWVPFLFTINKLAILATFLSDQKQPIYIYTINEEKFNHVMLIQRELESQSPVSITNPKQQNYMYINETIQALNFTLQYNRLKPIMTQVLLATLAQRGYSLHAT